MKTTESRRNGTKALSSYARPDGRGARPTRPMTDFSIIGKPIAMVDAAGKTSGAGKYTDDLSLPGMLVGKILHSPHPHARIKRIDVPEGIAVLTGKDMAADGVGPMRAGWALPGMVEPPRWALARDMVRHIGEPVAAVFAESKALAEDAAEKVEVEYEPLPLIDHEQAFKWARGDRAATDAAMRAAAHRIQIELVNNRLCGAAIETRALSECLERVRRGKARPR